VWRWPPADLLAHCQRLKDDWARQATAQAAASACSLSYRSAGGKGLSVMEMVKQSDAVSRLQQAASERRSGSLLMNPDATR